MLINFFAIKYIENNWKLEKKIIIKYSFVYKNNSLSSRPQWIFNVSKQWMTNFELFSHEEGYEI
jgi:hypothetical protein